MLEDGTQKIIRVKGGYGVQNSRVGKDFEER
jgi:hypothetical protein